MSSFRARMPVLVLASLALVMPALVCTATDSRRVERSDNGSTCPTGAAEIAAPRLRALETDKHCPLVGRLVAYNGVAVTVPPAGMGVSASADSGLPNNGSGSGAGGVSLDVRTAMDGSVTVDYESEPPPASHPTPAPAAAFSAFTAFSASTADYACSMTAHNFRGWRWTPGVTAYFQVNTTEGRPSNITGSTFLLFQRYAAANVSAAYNNCRIAFKPHLKIAFRSTTTSNSNINGRTNSCGNPDGHNVLDYGNLASSLLALNCTWYRNVSGSVARIVESDTRFDNTGRSWFTNIKGCTGARYDLLSVATHEMGHWVGLGHVADRGSRDLTMSAGTTPCNTWARTLGRGDIIALNIPY